MSSLFGQVWLWSLLSFVAGVALTWLVLVRPAKQELQDLEDRFLSVPRPSTPVATPPPAPTPAPAPAEPARDEFDDWHAGSRSPVEDLLRDEEPPRYDVAAMKRDERDRPLEQPADEHRPPADYEEQHDFPEYEDDRPRSLFERLTPNAEPAPVGAATPVVAAPQDEPTAPPEVEAFQPREVWRQDSDGVPEVYGEDADLAEGREQEDEPESPAEQTTLIPATALAQAIAEVDAKSTDEPGQLWPDHDLTGEYPVIREDLPTSESTTVLDARAIADHAPANDEPAEKSTGEKSADDKSAGERPADEPFVPKFQPEGSDTPLPDRSTPAHRAEPDQPFTPKFQPETPASEQPFTPKFQPEHAPPKTSTPEPFTPAHQAEPEQPAPPKRAEPPAAEQPKPAEPARPRSLFEPVLTPEDVEEEPPAPPKPARSAGDDQPFVPKLAPELLEKGNGLPQRPVRPAAPPPPPPPPPASKPITPPPPRPVRPRPVGFSPSTGGQPANGATTRYQQPEGFNPRSPFGPGSVLPKSDGMAPAPDFHVKATLAGRRYFTSESTGFGETRADVWFRTTSDAEKAGFRPA